MASALPSSDRKQRLSGLGHAGHRRHLLDQLIPIVVDHPFERLTLVSIARISGVSLWVLRGAFGNVANLLSAVTNRAIDVVVDDLDYEVRHRESVMEAIRGYARFLAARIQSPNYRNVLLILIRNRTSVRWVQEAYNNRIVQKICRDLEAVVNRSGAPGGCTVSIKEGAAKRFYKRMETALALPSLLPDAAVLQTKEIERALEEIVHEAFAATFLFEWDGVANSAKTMWARSPAVNPSPAGGENQIALDR